MVEIGAPALPKLLRGETSMRSLPVALRRFAARPHTDGTFAAPNAPKDAIAPRNCRLLNGILLVNFSSFLMLRYGIRFLHVPGIIPRIPTDAQAFFSLFERSIVVLSVRFMAGDIIQHSHRYGASNGRFTFGS